MADVGDRRAAAHRLRHPGPRLAVHAKSASTARPSATALGRQPVGAPLGNRRLARHGGRPRPQSDRDATRCGARTRALRSGCERRVSMNDNDLAVVHVSAGNPFRRWPESSFAALVAGLAASDDRRRIVLSSGPSDRLAADRIADAARRELGPTRAAQVLAFGDVDLPELRALIAQERALCRRRHRPPAHRVDDEDTDRRYLRPDAGGTLRAVARSGHCHGSGAGNGPPLPAVRTASLRSRGLQVPDDHCPAGGHCRC